ncbi:hypothetical protein C8R45DRAFT_1136242 [Mycena sanguinolenta]|nr:hypothetical protein C8R45DRAFT_1136242 [Mycena sanguinolenta]
MPLARSMVIVTATSQPHHSARRDDGLPSWPIRCRATRRFRRLVPLLTDRPGVWRAACGASDASIVGTPTFAEYDALGDSDTQTDNTSSSILRRSDLPRGDANPQQLCEEDRSRSSSWLYSSHVNDHEAAPRLQQINSCHTPPSRRTEGFVVSNPCPVLALAN